MRVWECALQCALIIMISLIGFAIAVSLSTLIGLLLASALYLVSIIFALGLETQPEFWSKSWFIASTLSLMTMFSMSMMSKMDAVRRDRERRDML